MELVSFAQETLQNVAEHAASYRFGQMVLKQLDRGLWVVEKCARWAVPPPLDQDERPQPELVRPLPWVFFLMLLVTLRVTREFISLINLVMGKPPLRSADVVMYIQSKRRYLRTLKYQGNRIQRARTSSAQPTTSWYSKMQSLFEVTMCFRGRQSHYGNNNTSTNNEELLVVKRSKRGREASSPVASTSETSMERLIEKMMVDLDADSDEDSSFTLTNATSLKSDISDTAESDQDTICHNQSTPTKSNEVATPSKAETSPKTEENIDFSSQNNVASSTPEKQPQMEETIASPSVKLEKDISTSEGQNMQTEEKTTLPQPEEHQLESPKTESQMFLQNEKCSPLKVQTPPKNEQKIANGRTMSAQNKKRGNRNERRDADASVIKNKSRDRSF